MTASTNVGIIVESLAVTRDGDEIAAEIGGNITMTDASVDYSETMINVRGATGGLDVCRGTNEITKARHMVDVAIQQGTKVAASCALQGDTGKQVFESGIRSFIAKTELASGLTAEELERMDVAIDGYSVSADAMYGNSVREFRETLDEVIRNYLQETDDHKDPVINDRDLLTCEKHDIELAAGSSAQS